MKKILFLFIVLALTNLPISCDNCGPFAPKESTIAELISFVGSYNQSGYLDSISTNHEFSAIKISISFMNSRELSENRKNDIAFITSALACDPPAPVPTQAIESIIITAEKSVFTQSEEYEAGENLVGLFKVVRDSYTIKERTVQDFIKAQQDTLTLFGYIGNSIILQLTDEPDSAIYQSLNVQFEFSDAEKISIQTPAFQVLN